AVLRAEAAVAQLGRDGPAGVLVLLGNADLGTELAAAFEDAQDVAGLADLEARQRVEEGDDAALLRFLLGRRRVGLGPQRHAAHAVELAVARHLEGHRAVVVQGGPPQHATVRHHALADLVDDVAVAVDGAAADVVDAL